MAEWSALDLVGSTVGRVRRTLGLDEAAGDPALDRLARLASRLLDVPVALVSLVDVDEQVFPGQAGLAPGSEFERGSPLSHSFCKTVVATRLAGSMATKSPSSSTSATRTVAETMLIARRPPMRKRC